MRGILFCDLLNFQSFNFLDWMVPCAGSSGNERVHCVGLQLNLPISGRLAMDQQVCFSRFSKPFTSSPSSERLCGLKSYKASHSIFLPTQNVHLTITVQLLPWRKQRLERAKPSACCCSQGVLGQANSKSTFIRNRSPSCATEEDDRCSRGV